MNQIGEEVMRLRLPKHMQDESDRGGGDASEVAHKHAGSINE